MRFLRALFLLLGAALAAVGWLTACSREGPYARKNGVWHFEGRMVEGADAASFEPLNEVFARDRQRGYFRGLAIEGSEGASFQALGPHDARDRSRVWHAETYRKGQEYWAIRHVRVFAIEGADPASYRVLADDYSADHRRAYFEGRPFPVRDAGSFSVLAGGFTRDRERGYYDRIEIAGSDGATLAMLDDRDASHARDQRRAYHGHIEINVPGKPAHPVVRVIEGAEVARLRALGRGYASDGRGVWFQGQPVKGSQAESFQVLEIGPTPEDEADAQDAQGRFRQGRRIGG